MITARNFYSRTTQQYLFKNGTAIFIQERLSYETIEVNDLQIVLCSICPLRSRPSIVGCR